MIKELYNHFVYREKGIENSLKSDESSLYQVLFPQNDVECICRIYKLTSIQTCMTIVSSYRLN